MSKLAVPQRVTTRPKRMSKLTRRECAIVAKSAGRERTPGEQAALRAIRAAEEAESERHSEGRIPHYHDLPIAQNYHD